MTYDNKAKYGRCGPVGSTTYGGYSTNMVVHQHFGVKLPSDYPLEKAGTDRMPSISAPAIIPSPGHPSFSSTDPSPWSPPIRNQALKPLGSPASPPHQLLMTP